MSALSQLTGNSAYGSFLQPGAVGGAQAGTTGVAGNTVQQAETAANKVAPTLSTYSGSGYSIGNPLAAAQEAIKARPDEYSGALAQEANSLNAVTPGSNNLQQLTQFFNDFSKAANANPFYQSNDRTKQIAQNFADQAASLNQQEANALAKYGVGSFTPQNTPTGFQTK